MIRLLLILVALLSPASAYADEFPFPTPRCGKNFITLYQTGTIHPNGTLTEGVSYRSVRKSDILSMSKHLGKDGVFVVVFRSPGKPGYEVARVAWNTYIKVLECLN